MIPRRATALLPALLLLVTACGESSSDLSPLGFDIVNGVASFDPAVVQMTDAQVRAVGALFVDRTIQGTACTGTLVADDLVLTAAHCVIDSGSEGSVTSVTFLGGRADYTVWEQHSYQRRNENKRDIIYWGLEPSVYRIHRIACVKQKQRQCAGYRQGNQSKARLLEAKDCIYKQN